MCFLTKQKAFLTRRERKEMRKRKEKANCYTSRYPPYFLY